MNTIVKILGLVLLVLGFILTFKPDLVEKYPSISGYQMIEKRIKWGFLFGFGIFLIFNEKYAFDTQNLFALLIALTIGIISSRISGLILDGFSSKQLLWLMLEVIILIISVVLYRQKI